VLRRSSNSAQRVDDLLEAEEPGELGVAAVFEHGGCDDPTPIQNRCLEVNEAEPPPADSASLSGTHGSFASNALSGSVLSAIPRTPRLEMPRRMGKAPP
jgi:hypothetical protein